ncbi:oligo-1,6-glucosidase [Ornithinimicrobium humiphilum]|uniref:Oligo-1,6-glucosidase n=1 Tax=Ornithinimicrobium humiphilum TaxID=125288 RepID=A0A543K7S2_9MICO|nr:alpha-glucosidase [Ornithinimicrobium humiphilum]TQM91136.1 oligo-1,6-glucosidase [Ornithinimicrobium humiphilum]
MLTDDLPRDWWKRAVVYQVYPRSFADSDGDGVGDLRGVISRLDHLQRLGVDVLWLGPVYRSPQDDNGYDISDYQDVDPLFGTLADLDELLARAHDRGIRVVMDLVVNHTSDEHPWFVDSRSSRDSARRDWYVWRPPRPGTVGGEPGAEPTNWGSVFSGSAWEWDEATGDYYLHLFSRKQPDLNWQNPEVREAVYAMMRWWLDRGVDGFRMDVINLIDKPDELVDAEVGLGDLWGQGFPMIANGARVHDHLREMHEQVFADHPRAFLTVGEMPGVTAERAALFTDPARREVDMVFQFEHVDLGSGPGGKFDRVPSGMPHLRESLMRWQTALAETGWNSLYWNNHDQPRAVSRFGDDDPAWRERSAKTLGTVLHTLRGTPYVYQGEELGMTNAPVSGREDLRDIEALNYLDEMTAAGSSFEDLLPGIRAVGRDNARTPVQWTAGRHAGFTTGEPWIAVNPDHVEINAEAQVGVEGSVFEHYRRLVALRHDDPVVSHGSITPLAMDHPSLWAFEREHEGVRLRTLAAFTREPVPVPAELLAGWRQATVVLATSDEAGRSLLEDGVLPGWESVVLRLAS